MKAFIFNLAKFLYHGAAMIKKSQVEFEKFVEQSDTIFWQIDKEGRVIYVSSAIERILGYQPNEFIGKTLPPDVPKNRIDEYMKTKSILCSISPQPFKGMIRPRQHKNGQIIMLEITGTPQFDEKGNFTGYIGESKKTTSPQKHYHAYEEKFFSNEIFWQSIVNTLPIRFFWKDRLLRYSGANQLFLRDLGIRTLSKIVGKDDFTLANPDIASIYREGDFEIVHLGKEFYTKETKIVTCEGRKLDIAIYKSPLKDYKGNIIGVAGAYIDITGTKTQEKELKEYLNRLKIAQEMAHIVYWDYDPVNNRAYWSDDVYRMFGYENSKPTMTLERCLDHVVEEDRPMVEKALKKAFSDKNFKYDITYRILKQTGELAYLHSKAKVTFQDGKPVWVRGIGQDITEMKKLQIENEKKQSLLMRQSRLVQMGQLLNNIAHQWKQPLAELNALILDLENDFIENRLDRKRFDRFFEEFEHTTSFMGETIENFRAYVTPSENIGITKPGNAIHEVLNLLKQRSEKIGVDYDIQISDCIEVFGSDQDFVHIFLVLLNNAMDAFERNQTKKPKIAIFVKQGENYCEITVKDNAGGIDKKIVEHIFDPFFTSKLQERGSGIGLFMAKAIVETRLQGKLELVDRIETTFRLRLKGLS